MIFNNLYRLQAAFSSSELQLFPTFLESCPVLKNLILDYSVSEEPEQFELTNVPRCLTSTLEYVEIKELIMREKTGIKVVNYFLENSAVLKNLSLRLADSPMTTQDSEINRKLLTSTKLSRSCEVSVY
uniref:Putative F-box/FBD/LRR-repeat protein n=1 Tax=Noccaea caerulescens TaxID=107243 RepID=A0A1J3JYA5_NOCCA